MSSTVDQEVGQIPPVEGSSLGERTTALTVQETEVSSNGSIAAFASQNNFLAAQRIAKALASSSLVPKAYQGQNGVANCLVAMELASRTGASVLMVMQNLHVIQGRPSWGASFLIASVNSCGRFSPIRYEFEGTQGQKNWACRAVARDLASSDLLYGEWITWDMVTAEGWLNKAGSKWKTMPGQMIRYRAASFWVRTYAPEISIGMHTSEEVLDIASRPEATTGTRDLNSALRGEVTVEALVEEAGDAAEPAGDTATAVRLAPRKCELCLRSDGTHEPTCPFAD
jgi:hypothetical protein